MSILIIGGSQGAKYFSELIRQILEQLEKQTLKNMGYKSIETVGKKNTLVAANTFGFHKRGIAVPQTYRETLSIEYRPQAFWKY